MKYVLMVILTTYYGHMGFTQEFDDKDSCLYVMHEVRAQTGFYLQDMPLIECFPKGKQP